MKSIKFSHDYQKLPEKWEGTKAMLMALTCGNIEELEKELPGFLKYDTTFRGEEGRYPLDFKDAIILFFVHESGKPFTTIRREYPSKYNYYFESCGDWFELVSTKEKS
jgi:hypothetical protein